ncbi:MAG: hypothetical protein KF729_15180 [Sandaracinaceae bacterium]|nr:hypothetical protein [Sandaracinaceae bacterium]
MRSTALILLGALALASPALAQGPRDALAAPSDAIRPTPAPPSPVAEETAGVPEPPGAHLGEVRYPLPGLEHDASAEPAIRIPSRTTTRLRALDANLRALAQRGGGNVVNAVLSMLTGGLAITLGALQDNPTDWMSVYLYVYGGASALRGVLELVLAPNASGPAITYQHMPMTTNEEVDARVAYGEAQLEDLARRGMLARVLDASINLAAGAAVVPFYLAPSGFELGSPIDYFVLIGAGISIVSGIISLATSSAEEQRWEAYARLRDRLDEEHRDEQRGHTEPRGRTEPAQDELSWHLDASPAPTGGFATFGLTF